MCVHKHKHCVRKTLTHLDNFAANSTSAITHNGASGVDISSCQTPGKEKATSNLQIRRKAISRYEDPNNDDTARIKNPTSGIPVACGQISRSHNPSNMHRVVNMRPPSSGNTQSKMLQNSCLDQRDGSTVYCKQCALSNHREGGQPLKVGKNRTGTDGLHRTARKDKLSEDGNADHIPKSQAQDGESLDNVLVSDSEQFNSCTSQKSTHFSVPAGMTNQADSQRGHDSFTSVLNAHTSKQRAGVREGPGRFTVCQTQDTMRDDQSDPFRHEFAANPHLSLSLVKVITSLVAEESSDQCVADVMADQLVCLHTLVDRAPLGTGRANASDNTEWDVRSLEDFGGVSDSDNISSDVPQQYVGGVSGRDDISCDVPPQCVGGVSDRDDISSDVPPQCVGGVSDRDDISSDVPPQCVGGVNDRDDISSDVPPQYVGGVSVCDVQCDAISARCIQEPKDCDFIQCSFISSQGVDEVSGCVSIQCDDASHTCLPQVQMDKSHATDSLAVESGAQSTETVGYPSGTMQISDGKAFAPCPVKIFNTTEAHSEKSSADLHTEISNQSIQDVTTENLRKAINNSDKTNRGLPIDDVPHSECSTAPVKVVLEKNKDIVLMNILSDTDEKCSLPGMGTLQRNKLLKEEMCSSHSFESAYSEMPYGHLNMSEETWSTASKTNVDLQSEETQVVNERVLSKSDEETRSQYHSTHQMTTDEKSNTTCDLVSADFTRESFANCGKREASAGTTTYLRTKDRTISATSEIMKLPPDRLCRSEAKAMTTATLTTGCASALQKRNLRDMSGTGKANTDQSNLRAMLSECVIEQHKPHSKMFNNKGFSTSSYRSTMSMKTSEPIESVLNHSSKMHDLSRFRNTQLPCTLFQSLRRTSEEKHRLSRNSEENPVFALPLWGSKDVCTVAESLLLDSLLQTLNLLHNSCRHRVPARFGKTASQQPQFPHSRSMSCSDVASIANAADCQALISCPRSLHGVCLTVTDQRKHCKGSTTGQTQAKPLFNAERDFDELTGQPELTKEPHFDDALLVNQQYGDSRLGQSVRLPKSTSTSYACVTTINETELKEAGQLGLQPTEPPPSPMPLRTEGKTNATSCTHSVVLCHGPIGVERKSKITPCDYELTHTPVSQPLGHSRKQGIRTSAPGQGQIPKSGFQLKRCFSFSDILGVAEKRNSKACASYHPQGSKSAACIRETQATKSEDVQKIAFSRSAQESGMVLDIHTIAGPITVPNSNVMQQSKVGQTSTVDSTVRCARNANLLPSTEIPVSETSSPSLTALQSKTPNADKCGLTIASQLPDAAQFRICRGQLEGTALFSQVEEVQQFESNAEMFTTKCIKTQATSPDRDTQCIESLSAAEGTCDKTKDTNMFSKPFGEQCFTRCDGMSFGGYTGRYTAAATETTGHSETPSCDKPAFRTADEITDMSQQPQCSTEDHMNRRHWDASHCDIESSGETVLARKITHQHSYHKVCGQDPLNEGLAVSASSIKSSGKEAKTADSDPVQIPCCQSSEPCSLNTSTRDYGVTEEQDSVDFQHHHSVCQKGFDAKDSQSTWQTASDLFQDYCVASTAAKPELQSTPTVLESAKERKLVKAGDIDAQCSRMVSCQITAPSNRIKGTFPSTLDVQGGGGGREEERSDHDQLTSKQPHACAVASPTDKNVLEELALCTDYTQSDELMSRISCTAAATFSGKGLRRMFVEQDCPCTLLPCTSSSDTASTTNSQQFIMKSNMDQQNNSLVESHTACTRTPQDMLQSEKEFVNTPSQPTVEAGSHTNASYGAHLSIANQQCHQDMFPTEIQSGSQHKGNKKTGLASALVPTSSQAAPSRDNKFNNIVRSESGDDQTDQCRLSRRPLFCLSEIQNTITALEKCAAEFLRTSPEALVATQTTTSSRVTDAACTNKPSMSSSKHLNVSPHRHRDAVSSFPAMTKRASRSLSARSSLVPLSNLVRCRSRSLPPKWQNTHGEYGQEANNRGDGTSSSTLRLNSVRLHSVDDDLSELSSCTITQSCLSASLSPTCSSDNEVCISYSDDFGRLSGEARKRQENIELEDFVSLERAFMEEENQLHHNLKPVEQIDHSQPAFPSLMESIPEEDEESDDPNCLARRYPSSVAHLLDCIPDVLQVQSVSQSVADIDNSRRTDLAAEFYSFDEPEISLSDSKMMPFNSLETGTVKKHCGKSLHACKGRENMVDETDNSDHHPSARYSLMRSSTAQHSRESDSQNSESQAKTSPLDNETKTRIHVNQQMMDSSIRNNPEDIVADVDNHPDFTREQDGAFDNTGEVSSNHTTGQTEDSNLLSDIAADTSVSSPPAQNLPPTKSVTSSPCKICYSHGVQSACQCLANTTALERPATTVKCTELVDASLAQSHSTALPAAINRKQDVLETAGDGVASVRSLIPVLRSRLHHTVKAKKNETVDPVHLVIKEMKTGYLRRSPDQKYRRNESNVSPMLNSSRKHTLETNVVSVCPDQQIPANKKQRVSDNSRKMTQAETVDDNLLHPQIRHQGDGSDTATMSVPKRMSNHQRQSSVSSGKTVIAPLKTTTTSETSHCNRTPSLSHPSRPLTAFSRKQKLVLTAACRDTQLDKSPISKTSPHLSLPQSQGKPSRFTQCYASNQTVADGYVVRTRPLLQKHGTKTTKAPVTQALDTHTNSPAASLQQKDQPDEESPGLFTTNRTSLPATPYCIHSKVGHELPGKDSKKMSATPRQLSGAVQINPRSKDKTAATKGTDSHNKIPERVMSDRKSVQFVTQSNIGNVTTDPHLTSAEGCFVQKANPHASALVQLERLCALEGLTDTSSISSTSDVCSTPCTLSSNASVQQARSEDSEDGIPHISEVCTAETPAKPATGLPLPGQPIPTKTTPAARVNETCSTDVSTECLASTSQLVQPDKYRDVQVTEGSKASLSCTSASVESLSDRGAETVKTGSSPDVAFGTESGPRLGLHWVMNYLWSGNTSPDSTSGDTKNSEPTQVSVLHGQERHDISSTSNISLSDTSLLDNPLTFHGRLLALISEALHSETSSYSSRESVDDECLHPQGSEEPLPVSLSVGRHSVTHFSQNRPAYESLVGGKTMSTDGAVERGSPVFADGNGESGPAVFADGSEDGGSTLSVDGNEDSSHTMFAGKRAEGGEIPTPRQASHSPDSLQSNDSFETCQSLTSVEISSSSSQEFQPISGHTVAAVSFSHGWPMYIPTAGPDTAYTAPNANALRRHCECSAVSSSHSSTPCEATLNPYNDQQMGRYTDHSSSSCSEESSS